ncbi:energy-coupling factor ABC transporter ATP-binding protein [Photobacterium kasasachensis]|uniref:energy-coupling factor ABC transporter ATP-binding protein n=1 Tax=Photobacterium kasasachensis TaxID=2910240 RepID=UPI003D0FBFBB
MSELIALEQLSYSRPNGKVCVEQLDFSLSDSDRIAITGSNGCGKSTLLQLILGLLPADKGNVRLFGESCYNKNRLDEAKFRQYRTRIGLVFQDPDDQLFCPTVIDDVCFGPLNQGFSVIEARQKAIAILSQLGIGDLTECVSYQLSGGQKRLVALATVLVMEPEALLLDEPTNDLDQENKQRLLEILHDCQLPMIIVSHDKQFRSELVSQEYCLQQGRLVSVSTANIEGASINQEAVQVGDGA